jgi:MoaA/NifB/PqqE/SkfB family radical SAM enzyme
METPLPESISLEVTNHCNLCCSHCGHHHYPKFDKGHFELAYLDKILPFLGGKQIKNLHLSDYGEPFLSPKFKQIFTQAQELTDLTISFNTNGILLHKNWSIFNYPRLQFNVSLDGASEATYSHFRGKGYFNKVVANLRELKTMENRGIIQSSTRGFIVVLSKINVHEMPQIVTLAYELGFNYVVFIFQIFFDSDDYHRESLFFAQEKYNKHLELAIQIAEKLSICIIHADSFDGRYRIEEEAKCNWLYRDNKQRIICGALEKNCYIKLHGQVEACSLPDRLPLGSLKNDDFLNIWHGAYYRRLRLSFRQNRWLSKCKNCNSMQSVDVISEQSHYIKVSRDSGSHIDMPQPYNITDINRIYTSAIKNLENNLVVDTTLTETQTNINTRSLDMLLRLSHIDSNFFEVENAMGVTWSIIGDQKKACSYFKRALQINPDDELALSNQKTLQNQGR